MIPFSPPPGLNSDDTTFSAEGRWAAGVNVRFYEGKPQVRGGESLLFNIDPSNGVARCILPFNRSSAVTVAYGMTPTNNGSGGTAKLYVGSGVAAPSDRTPAGLVGTEKNWSLAPWGNTLLAVPENGTLYEQSGTGTATAVAAAPDNITYMLVTPERQVLAFGCNEEVSTTFNGLCIRGCDPEDYTNWTTSAADNAFEHILDGAGSIVAARMVGAYVAVLTTNSLWIGQFIGNPDQTYRFDPVSHDCGLIGPNAVTEVAGTLYWMGPDFRFHSWSPGALVQTLPCPIGKAFRDNINKGATTRYVVASHNPRFNEIRFDHESSNADASGQDNNYYVAVCLTDGSWHAGNGGRSAICSSEVICSATANIGGSSIIGANKVGNFYEMEIGDALIGTAPYIQSAGVYLDNSQRRVMIRSFIPDFESQDGDISLTLYCRDRPQSTPVTKGPYTVTSTATKKDFRASGKIFEVQIAGAATQSAFRIGKPLFDTVPLGER